MDEITLNMRHIIFLPEPLHNIYSNQSSRRETFVVVINDLRIPPTEIWSTASCWRKTWSRVKRKRWMNIGGRFFFLISFVSRFFLFLSRNILIVSNYINSDKSTFDTWYRWSHSNDRSALCSKERQRRRAAWFHQRTLHNSTEIVHNERGISPSLQYINPNIGMNLRQADIASWRGLFWIKFGARNNWCRRTEWQFPVVVFFLIEHWNLHNRL